jgi:L-threonylcarbamoyladenylate synthase
VASLEQAWKYINDRDVLPDASTTFNKLAKKYWPGPLTIVVPANCEFVPEEVRVGQTTVGLRVPDSVDLLDVMAKTGPLAAPSANLSGQQPALSAPEVLRIFGEDFPVLDGGVCRVGEASTVVELVSGEMKILREGTIAAKDLRG